MSAASGVLVAPALQRHTARRRRLYVRLAPSSPVRDGPTLPSRSVRIARALRFPSSVRHVYDALAQYSRTAAHRPQCGDASAASPRWYGGASGTRSAHG
jgi:hypothetical protein